MKTLNINELLAEKKTERMPAIFVGHGSPMNAIENSEFSEVWKYIGKTIAKPKAILSISAHWETKGSYVTAMDKPKTIHDFGGFPADLYRMQYPAEGSPSLASHISSIVQNQIHLDYDWGLDHGTWSILVHMFPKADIPVIQLSIDYTKSPEEHYKLGQELSQLRDEGVLIFGSGNTIHNLRAMYVEDGDFNKELAHDWATEFNNKVKDSLLKNDYQSLINYQSFTPNWRMSVPTPDHYSPILYLLGTQREEDDIALFNDKIIAGAIGMTSFVYK